MRPYAPFKRPGFRRFQDYEAGEMYRIQDFEGELRPESLVTIMIAVDSERRSRRAVQVLARVWSVTPGATGTHDIHFNVHTTSNKPCFDLRETFREGRLEGPVTEGPIVDHLEAPILGAYFQPYQLESRESVLQSIIASAP